MRTHREEIRYGFQRSCFCKDDVVLRGTSRRVVETHTWDDRIEAALELVFYFISQSWQGDGVIRGVLGDDLKVLAKSTPGMARPRVPGYALITRFPFKLAEETETVDVAEPVTNGRIDLVQAQLDTWSIDIKTGTEAVTPVAPTADSGCIALAYLHLRPGMASIKNADDATNGYIEDQRSFV